MILMDGRVMQTMMLPVLLAIMLVLSMPAAATSSQLTISVQTHRRYFSHEVGFETVYASFYLFGGRDVEWWQGGAVFMYVLPNEVARQMVENLTRALVNTFRDLGFIIVSGTVKPRYVRMVYVFDGVLEFEGFYFADEDGTVTVEWSEGKPLVITVECKATVKAETASYLGRADWRLIEANGGIGILWPEIKITPTGDRMKLLVVPREGYTGITEQVSNYYGNETRTLYLGGGPALHEIDANAYGYSLRDSGTFWGRFPAVKVVYDGAGRHMSIIDWFWQSEIPA